MKYFIVTLFIVSAIIACATSSYPDDEDTNDDHLAEVCYRYFEGLDMKGILKCLAHGQHFNGYKTCQVGCRLACQQPFCGGFDKCTQVPNVRLHKYKCHCNSP